MDLIQARYGWTDEYVLETLPVERVMTLFKNIGQYRNEEKKEKLREQAFNAWLSSGSEMDYGSFLNSLNLGDEVEHVSKEEALEKAHEILSMLKGDELDAGLI